MFISWVSGESLLQEHRAELERGQYKVAIFFLITEYDSSRLAEVVHLANELDAATTSSCLVVAFMPPPADPQEALSRYRPRMLPDENEEAWKEFIASMTQASYELANYFGIPYEDMPCVVFFSIERGDEYALMRLRDQSFWRIFPQLRKLFSDWMAEGGQSVEVHRGRIALASSPGRVTSQTSSGVRAVVESVLTDSVIPALEAELKKVAKTNAMRRRVSGLINGLNASPLNVGVLAAFLQREGLELTIDGVTFDSIRAVDAYDEAYRTAANTKYRSVVESGTTPVAPFPFEKISGLDRSISIRHIGGQTAAAVARVGNTLKWFFDLRKAVVG